MIDFHKWLDEEGWYEAAPMEYDNINSPNSCIRLTIEDLFNEWLKTIVFMFMNNKYKHLKSGNIYELLAFDVTNATNDQDGQEMVLYMGKNRDGTKEKVLFVREYNEFMRKFKKVE